MSSSTSNSSLPFSQFGGGARTHRRRGRGRRFWRGTRRVSGRGSSHMSVSKASVPRKGIHYSIESLASKGYFLKKYRHGKLVKQKIVGVKRMHDLVRKEISSLKKSIIGGGGGVVGGTTPRRRSSTRHHVSSPKRSQHREAEPVTIKVQEEPNAKGSLIGGFFGGLGFFAAEAVFENVFNAIFGSD